mgnify:CR=1 FL=1
MELWLLLIMLILRNNVVMLFSTRFGRLNFISLRNKDIIQTGLTSARDVKAFFLHLGQWNIVHFMYDLFLQYSKRKIVLPINQSYLNDHDSDRVVMKAFVDIRPYYRGSRIFGRIIIKISGRIPDIEKGRISGPSLI